MKTSLNRILTNFVYSEVMNLKHKGFDKMRSSLFLLILGFIFTVFQGEASASQSASSSSSSEGAVTGIIEKMKKNDPLSFQEKRTFENALSIVENKIKSAGGAMTSLSSFEQSIYSQDQLNKTTPTINDILESGLQFPWGMDLDMVENRGKAIRVSISGGGADLTSVITTYQSNEDFIAKKTKEKEDAIQQITKITEETKAKLASLNTVNFLKRASEKKKIQEEEKASLGDLQKKIETLNQTLKNMKDGREKALTTMMTITKLGRAVIEKLPTLSAWKEMKAHPETIPQKIDPSILKRPRRAAPSAPLRGVPQS